MRPLSGVRVSLVSDVASAPYSGMLPGHIAGLYSWEEMHIDLRRLCAAAGVVFVRGEVSGLDAANRTVRLNGRPSLRYDVLSINTGGTPAPGSVPGAAEFAIPAKPVPELLAGWSRIQSAARERPVRVVLTGGGAGGVELALGMRRQLGDQAEITLVHRGETLLDSHPPKAASLLSTVLQERGIRVLTSTEVRAITSRQVLLSGPEPASLEADFVLWVTSVAPAPWLASSGLAVDAAGFVRVSESLQSLSHPEVFAAGDTVAFPRPLPKSGVYAVRMARPLADNLRNYFADRPLRRWRPQRSFLSLIGTADGKAVASRGRWAFRAAWLWKLKDRIDRRFMRRFADLPPMKPAPPRNSAAEVSGEEPVMRCRGCASKVGHPVLSGVLDRLRQDFPAVLRHGNDQTVRSGLDSPDDAAVFLPPPGHALVQTVDSLPALVEDPFLFGRIAALHSLSDLFAMGAKPHSFLAAALVPYGGPDLTAEILYQLLAGVCTVLRDSGARLLGGHTSEGHPMALTLTCNGLTGPEDRLMTKGGLRSGDVLILTKPLGVGVLFAAEMRLEARASWIDAALGSMLRSNQAAARVFSGCGVTGCTDVTGFGLAGHLQEMLDASGCGAEIALDSLPLLDGAQELSALGVRSSLYPANAAAAVSGTGSGALTRHPNFPLLFDPQTAGGLLAGVPESRAEECLTALRDAGYPETAVIGRVIPAQEGTPALTLS